MGERRRSWLGRFLSIASIHLALLGSASAASWQPEAYGFRVGASATSLDELYAQVEVLLRWPLVETSHAADPAWLGLDLDWTAGVLSGQGNSGLVSTLGPLVRVGIGDFPLAFEGGISPTFISKRVFDEDDFGGHLQFTSHAGFSYRLSERTSLAYRFQHMSNANLGDSNPGLNLHVLTLVVRL